MNAGLEAVPAAAGFLGRKSGRTRRRSGAIPRFSESKVWNRSVREWIGRRAGDRLTGLCGLEPPVQESEVTEMASYNRVVLMGNLTCDVYLRYLATGTPLATFGIAVDERIRKGDRWEDHTKYFEVTVLGKLAETCAEQLSKGREVLLEGRLKQDRWELGGEKHSRMRVIADAVQLPGGIPGPSPPAGGAPPQSGAEDIPF
jgi:single-strand DNA-binding protein